MNNRGQIAFALIPIVAIVLCVAALYTFVSFKGYGDDKSNVITASVSEAAFSRGYIVELCKYAGEKSIQSGQENIAAEFQRVISEREAYKIDSIGVFMDAVKNNKFDFKMSGENYALNLDRITLSAKQGDSSITQSFGLNIIFDKSGNPVEVAVISADDAGRVVS